MGYLKQASQQCNQCGSGHGLAIYSDNEHCFSCGYHRSFGPRNFALAENKNTNNPILPDDYTLDIPEDHLIYFTQVGIDAEKVMKYRIGYSKMKDALVVPTYVDEILACYQLVRHKTKEKITIGKRSPFFCCEQSDKKIVIVEDVRSALKLSYVANSVCLLGAYVPGNKSLANLLYKHARSFVVWLDGDKAGIANAKKLYAQMQMLGKTSNITTLKDPKYFSLDELRYFLCQT
jgi:ribosomal protein S27AE